MAKILFNTQKDAVLLKFNNGSESMYYTDIEEFILAIHNCFLKQKITAEEEYLFIEEILFGKHNLPRKQGIILAVDDILLKVIDLVITNNTPPLENPIFEICDCNMKLTHGYIKSKNGFLSSMFITKAEGFLIVRKLLQSKLITEGEAAQLNTLIDLSCLLEDPSFN